MLRTLERDSRNPKAQLQMQSIMRSEDVMPMFASDISKMTFSMAALNSDRYRAEMAERQRLDSLERIKRDTVTECSTKPIIDSAIKKDEHASLLSHEGMRVGRAPDSSSTLMDHKNKFIFIVTSGRSGSRLLAEIFDMSGLFVLFDKIEDNRGLFYESGKINALNSFIDNERYNLTFDYSKLRLYKKDTEKIKNWAKRFQKLLEEEDIETTVIKDPRLLYLIPIYKDSFKNSFFIHIVRDGRDFAISKNEESLHRGKKEEDPNFLLELWNYRMELLNRFRNKDWFYEIKFEDIVGNPKKELKALWDFLGIKNEVVIPKIDLARKGRYLQSSVRFNNEEGCKWLKKFNYI